MNKPTQKDIMVSVDGLSKTFRIPLEGSSGLKQKLINTLKGRKGYREFTPLNDISFQIEKGEFFGIVGRNGSGKSTLLKTIAGIYTANKGDVTVNGSLVPFIELGVGFNPELTGRENVFLNGSLLGFSKKEMDAMYDQIVKFAELSEFMDERLKNYSSGMQVRLAFSIAIRAESDILLLDEVLAVGDAAFQQKCFDYFEQLHRDKRTVILVTHDMGAVQRFCNKALFLKGGKIVKIGSPLEIADIYLQENIQAQVITETPEKKSSQQNVIIKIMNDTDEEVRAKFCFKGRTHEEVYIGFSLIKNGVVFAELNNLSNKDKLVNNSIDFNFDKKILNPGMYQISAAIFGVENKQLIAISRRYGKFTVKGYDETRGGAIKLDEAWIESDIDRQKVYNPNGLEH